jgi:urea transport system permease protein
VEHPAAVLEFRRRATIGVLTTLFVVMPALTMAGVVEPYNLNRMGRYLCFAIAALGIDLIWGYAGLLSLCHALFFCLGGYAIAMHLSLPGGGGDVRPEYNDIPQFFSFNGVTALPAWWEPFNSLPFSLAAAVLLPAILAAALGFFIFRNRVRGVYFSIITQALAWGAFLAFSRNEMLLGGTNGLTNFYKPLNSEPAWIIGLYLLTAGVLTLSFLACRHLVRSRIGLLLVAIRDRESRLCFLGHRPEVYKTFAFACAALLGAIGGLLYVPQNGIVTPNVMRVEDSIWMVIWVAAGGRGKLWGAVAGALIASFTYSMLTSDMPRAWPFIQAALFLTVLVFPAGISQLWSTLEREVAKGAGIARPLVVAGFVLAFLIADKSGWIPRALSLTEFAGVASKYWILIAAAAALSWGSTAPSAVPLITMATLVAGEALGLFPSEITILKYVAVGLLLALYAVRQAGMPSSAGGPQWRIRPVRSSP